MVSYFNSRYPVKRKAYTQSVGKLLPHRISQILQELGFKTWINRGQTNGVDLKVYDNGNNLLWVAEILNWSIGSLLSEKRKNCIIENLLCHNCKKVLIYTNFKNENILENLSNRGISLLKIGYQLLPKYFYDFFKAKDEIISRKIDSKETKEDIRRKIIEFLVNSEIKVNNDASVFSYLFQNRIFFSFFPLENENIIKKVQKRFHCVLSIFYNKYLVPKNFESEIKTKCGRKSIDEYCAMFSRSVFNCLINQSKYLSGKFIPPRRLYHGTTSSFVPKIVKEGLIPSIPGRYWSEDKYNWVKRVGLTDSMYAAEYFALNARKRFGGKPIVIEVDIEGLEDKLEIRPWSLYAERVIDMFMEIYYTDVIPPERLKNWYFLPDIPERGVVDFIISMISKGG